LTSTTTPLSYYGSPKGSGQPTFSRSTPKPCLVHKRAGKNPLYHAHEISCLNAPVRHLRCPGTGGDTGRPSGGTFGQAVVHAVKQWDITVKQWDMGVKQWDDINQPVTAPRAGHRQSSTVLRQEFDVCQQSHPNKRLDWAHRQPWHQRQLARNILLCILQVATLPCTKNQAALSKHAWKSSTILALKG
jgi:hypothetical protein